MPSPIPAPAISDSTGLPDSQWISDTRDALQDYPEYQLESWTADGVNGTVGSGAVPLKSAKRPMNDGSLTMRDNTSTTNYTVITTGAPAAGQVLVNYDTGEMRFNPVPANNDVVQWTYQSVKWRDGSIMTGLYAGMRAMFPMIGKIQTDTSIPIQVNVWDYTLPTWAQDPRSRIMRVEVADPYIPTEPFRPVKGTWERVDLTTLHIPRSQSYSPTARLRVVGWGPYVQLGDLEPQLYHLPIWYCLSTLLPKKEAFRLRQDTAVPVSQEGGQQPTLMTQTGDYYLQRFNEELKRLSKVPTPGGNSTIRTYRDRYLH
jgi:hypothetical protein